LGFAKTDIISLATFQVTSLWLVSSYIVTTFHWPMVRRPPWLLLLMYQKTRAHFEHVFYSPFLALLHPQAEILSAFLHAVILTACIFSHHSPSNAGSHFVKNWNSSARIASLVSLPSWRSSAGSLLPPASAYRSRCLHIKSGTSSLAARRNSATIRFGVDSDLSFRFFNLRCSTSSRSFACLRSLEPAPLTTAPRGNGRRSCSS